MTILSKTMDASGFEEFTSDPFPMLGFLIETKMNNSRIEGVRVDVGCPNYLFVDNVG